MLTVSGKALGRKKPLFADWSISLPPELSDHAITLRDVVTLVVRKEVDAFKQRQSDGQMFKVLTARQIEAGADKGKIAMGGSEGPVQEVDEDAAVCTALQAFDDGLYFVVIDDVQHQNLDSQVYLRPDSRITFVRLTLLAGG